MFTRGREISAARGASLVHSPPGAFTGFLGVSRRNNRKSQYLDQMKVERIENMVDPRALNQMVFGEKWLHETLYTILCSITVQKSGETVQKYA